MKHFMLDKCTAEVYAKEVLSIFEETEELEVEEIGDGNINYVFKIVSKDTGKSVVIKQADAFLRSSGRPLDLHRNKIEAEILKLEGALAPNMVPKIYHYDEHMYALCMEDISACKNLRKELLQGKTFSHLAESISTFLVDTLFPTTDLVMDRALKKEQVKLFTNPELCDISEDLVFTEPYWDYKHRNIITKGNEDFVRTHLYEDKELHAEVGALRDSFMNHPQALIHGDLHSGSIFINDERVVVIDPEFAFYGPIGYDVGNVIGNLVFALVHARYARKDTEDFQKYIVDTIKQIVDLFIEKINVKYDEIVKFPLYQTEGFKREYIRRILEDAVGYAGTEIIRRVVGDAKVAEVSEVQDLDIKIPMERQLLQIGIAYIKNRKDIKEGEEVASFLQF